MLKLQNQNPSLHFYMVKQMDIYIFFYFIFLNLYKTKQNKTKIYTWFLQ